VVTSTFLVTLFAPLFYVLIEKTLGKNRKRQATKTAAKQPSGGQGNE
jgi:HAE1 family hydrophobic/amphiphilic exporter-1